MRFGFYFIYSFFKRTRKYFFNWGFVIVIALVQFKMISEGFLQFGFFHLIAWIFCFFRGGRAEKIMGISFRFVRVVNDGWPPPPPPCSRLFQVFFSLVLDLLPPLLCPYAAAAPREHEKRERNFARGRKKCAAAAHTYGRTDRKIAHILERVRGIHRKLCFKINTFTKFLKKFWKTKVGKYSREAKNNSPWRHLFGWI